MTPSDRLSATACLSYAMGGSDVTARSAGELVERRLRRVVRLVDGVVRGTLGLVVFHEALVQPVDDVLEVLEDDVALAVPLREELAVLATVAALVAAAQAGTGAVDVLTDLHDAAEGALQGLDSVPGRTFA